MFDYCLLEFFFCKKGNVGAVDLGGKERWGQLGGVEGGEAEHHILKIEK